MVYKNNKNIRNKFAKLINKTKVYPGYFQTIKLLPIMWFLYKNLPKKIFKYREFNNLNLEAFMNDEIWCSQPTYFNDSQDCILYTNKTKIFTNLKERFEDVKDLDDTKLEYLYKFAIKDLISSSKMACFSDNIQSCSIWEHYGGSKKGFALEYSPNKFYKLNEIDNKISLYLLPIIYGKQKYNASKYFFIHLYNQIIAFYNIRRLFMKIDRISIFKMFLHKSLNWEYENEWRLMVINEDNNKQWSKGYTIKIPAQAVYLGHEIEEINKEKIIKIANSKNIPVYQMNIDLESKYYDLEYNKIL